MLDNMIQMKHAELAAGIIVLVIIAGAFLFLVANKPI